MPWYAITLQVDAEHAPNDEAVAALQAELSGDHGTVIGEPDQTRWSATVTIEVRNASEAAAIAVALVRSASGQAGMPWGDVAALEVLTEAEHERRLALPAVPPLVGAAEAADLLGVSRQRVHQLHTGNPRFPAPVVEVRRGPLWLRSSIEEFDQSWSRKPGRPALSLVEGSDEKP
jgi:hypothetical protein